MNAKERMIICSALKVKLDDSRMNRLYPLSTGNMEMVEFWDELIVEIEDLINKIEEI